MKLSWIVTTMVFVGTVAFGAAAGDDNRKVAAQPSSGRKPRRNTRGDPDPVQASLPTTSRGVPAVARVGSTSADSDEASDANLGRECMTDDFFGTVASWFAVELPTWCRLPPDNVPEEGSQICRSMQSMSFYSRIYRYFNSGRRVKGHERSFKSVCRALMSWRVCAIRHLPKRTII